ncbi:MAG TPA: AbgT family transporter [Bacteroidales bacterium]|nr:AbgT family transporter [Bacteroidales bacterium]HSA42329.1 AbgT family transporter [Bacteroidales bacterium]
MSRRKIPHTFALVFYLIVAAAVLTWIIPGGSFERRTLPVNGVERSVIVEGSFHYVEASPQTWQVFSAFFEGFVSKADIIVFILMIGGAFWIMTESKAIDVGIYSFLKFTQRLKQKRFFRTLGVDNLVITLIMLMFSIFGAVFGMSEETIAFVIIFVPLAISMGYDSITGVSMCFVAAGLGFAGALLNPFTIGIAQGIAEIPLFSGIEYRLFCWFVINVAGIAWVLVYASRIRKNPARSPVYKEDDYWRKRDSLDVDNINTGTPRSAWFTFGFLSLVLLAFSWFYPVSTLVFGVAGIQLPAVPVLTGMFIVLGIFSLRQSVHYFILNLLLFTILFLIVGVMGYQWYVMEIAALFLAMGIFTGLAFGLKADGITTSFLDGTKDIQTAALIVGMAGGILEILNDGRVIDTILYGVSNAMSDAGDLASISLMYTFQTLLNLILPSGSAKAALTMPIMAPFSDLIGVSRQAAVMAYQFGDGFTNMITPVSGVLMGVLGVAKIPYNKWFRWILPFMIMLILLGLLLLIPTIYIRMNGF